MPDFKAKMHQIRFWLGLCPRPRWGSLQNSAPPDPLYSWIKGVLLLRGEVGSIGVNFYKAARLELPPTFQTPRLSGF